MAVVLYGEEAHTVVHIQPPDLIMQKSQNSQKMRSKVEEDVAQQVGLYEGRRKRLEISSSCPFLRSFPDYLRNCYNASSATVTVA